MPVIPLFLQQPLDLDYMGKGFRSLRFLHRDIVKRPCPPEVSRIFHVARRGQLS